MGNACGCTINDNGDVRNSGGDVDDSASSDASGSNMSGSNTDSSLRSSSCQSKSLGVRLGSRTRSLLTIIDRGSHILMWLSPPVVQNTGVCFKIEKQHTFLVLGHGFIAIALEPPDHDLKVIIV
jgi:hypothetical protein